MTAPCTACGDVPIEGGPRCEFCTLFGATKFSAPPSFIRGRVMYEIHTRDERIESYVGVAVASMREARWWKRCASALVIALLAALVFAVMMLNALPSASAASARSAGADIRAERLLRQWCPSSMPRGNCIAWMRVAQCETGGGQRAVSYRSLRQIRWRYNGASGYDGALQFSPRTWRGNVGRVPARSLTRSQYVQRARGRYRYAWGSPPTVQVLAADALRVRRDGGGLGHWPVCGRRW